MKVVKPGSFAPDFFIVGAQKAGTSWLWEKLDQHPGTSLPAEKELHYFGSVELYNKGEQWYEKFFENLDPTKLIGDASTSYFLERMSYWYEGGKQSNRDESIPTIPRLITDRYPDAKFIVTLRDPVHRAVSAYSHFMKRGYDSPLKGLKRTVQEWPRMQILEHGDYLENLKHWQKHVPPERLKIIVFEDQIKVNAEKTLQDIYEYLDLDPTFVPESAVKAVHPAWSWTRIVFSYFAGKVYKPVGFSSFAKSLDKFDVIPNRSVGPEDIKFLQDRYLPQKQELEKLLNRDLNCWDYGSRLL